MTKREGDVEVIREGLTFKRLLHGGGHAPVRRGRVGDAATRSSRTSRRAANAFEQRGRRVPRHVVAERHEHRRPEVLPRHPRHAAARVVACARSSTAWSTRSRGGAARTATSSTEHEAEAFARRAEAPARHPEGGLQLARSGSTSASPGVPQQASACFILAVDDTMDSILNWYVEEGTIFKGGSGSGINLSKHPLVEGAAEGRRHGLAARSASCAAPTRPPARSSRAARPAAPRRWSSSTSTTPTSRSSSGARPARSSKARGAARRRLRHGPRRQATATRSSTRTRTTRSGSPTSSCRPSSTTPTGTSGPSPPARSSRRSGPAT